MDVDCSEFENLETSTPRTTGNEKNSNKDALTDTSQLEKTFDSLMKNPDGIDYVLFYKSRYLYI